MQRVQVKVRYFAAARELCNVDQEVFELAGAIRGTDVLAAIIERHPAFAPHAPRMRIAVNGELARSDAPIPGELPEVDVLPPVAGGSDALFAEVRNTPLSIDECVQKVSHPGAGGICIFTGVVRDHADGQAVARLDYEAHPTLALSEMKAVIDGVIGEVPGVRIAATHRVGELAIGDLAVVVAASAPHRAEAFHACRLVIDRIKETVPIWKKEWGADGSANWVNLEEM
ncbi:MAG: molybdenum cofactor biosynthesis protein MoaE [Myxococcota bacterium]